MLDVYKNTLREVGLSPKETETLWILLWEGSLPASQIARRTKLNRTTSYGILKSLAEKGLVSRTSIGGVTRFQSIDPRLLPDYIERMRSGLLERKKEIEGILPQIISARTKKNIFPRIQFFEGIEGVKQAYEDTLENNQGKQLLDISGTDAIFTRMDSEWLDYYLKKRTRLGIRCVDLAPNTEWSRRSKAVDKEVLRITKLIPAQFTFDTEIDIYDNKVGIFSYSEKEPIAVIIEDEAIANTMKTLFAYMESHAKA